MRKFHDEREAAVAAKEEAAKAKRERDVAEQLRALETQMTMKERAREVERAEDAAYAAEVARRADEAAEAEAAKAAARRAEAVANKMELRRQMEEKVERRVAEHDDIMGEQERRMNAAILDQATRVVLGGEAF